MSMRTRTSLLLTKQPLFLPLVLTFKVVVRDGAMSSEQRCFRNDAHHRHIGHIQSCRMPSGRRVIILNPLMIMPYLLTVDDITCAFLIESDSEGLKDTVERVAMFCPKLQDIDAGHPCPLPP